MADVVLVEPRAQYLEADGLGRLELTEANGFVVTSLDLGWPTVRAVSNNRVGANGADDTTAFYGPRAVSLEVGVFAPDDRTASRRDRMSRLLAYASPARRAVLVFWDDDGVPQRVSLRGESVTPPPRRPVGTAVTVMLAWSAPDGIVEELEQRTVKVSAFAATGGPGRTYPRRYPIRYPVRASAGSQDVVNGTEPAAPIYRLWGPCVNPRLVNVETGAEVRFGNTATGDLTLTADQYVEVNVRNATVTLNGRATESLYSRLDLVASSFAWLIAGTQRLRYVPKSFGSGAHADVLYRRAYL